MADNLRGYTPFELFNKVLNTDNNSLQVDIVDATGVTVTVDSEFPAAGALSDDAANPTTTSVGSFLMGYDSSNTNWNRVEVDDDGNLQVDVVSTPGDDSIVTLGTTIYSEASSKGTAIGAVRNDVLAALADTDNEWTPLQVNASGALYIDVANGGILESAVDGIEGLLTTMDSDTGDIKTAVEIIDNAIHVDDAAFTLGSHSGVMMMGFAGTQSVDANDAGALTMDTDGALHISDGGNSITVDNGGTFAVQADLGTDNDIRIESGQVKSGAIASGAVASGAIASGAVASGAIASGAVASGAFASGSISSGAIVAGAVAAGASSFVALEDDASANADAGVKVLARRTASPADTSGTDGDYEMLQMDNGKLWTSAAVTSLPASTNTIEVVGDAVEDEAVAGNPVLSGGRHDASVRNLDDGDVGALALDPSGALYVREYLGQAGSILVTGTTNAVTTSVANTKFIAIQFLEDTTFDAGAEGLVASTAGLWPDDNDASTTIDANGGAVTGSEVFPQGMTIFGRWDGFKLDSGKVIGYLGYV